MWKLFRVAFFELSQNEDVYFVWCDPDEPRNCIYLNARFFGSSLDIRCVPCSSPSPHPLFNIPHRHSVHLKGGRVIVCFVIRFQFVLQMIFLNRLFGCLLLLIIIKWCSGSQSDLYHVMIYMFLSPWQSWWESVVLGPETTPSMISTLLTIVAVWIYFIVMFLVFFTVD